MQFLNKLFQTREVAESFEGRTDNNQDEDVDVDTLPEAPLPTKETIRESPKPRPHKRRRQPDDVELKIIKALEEPPVSPHISFFQGLLPHLNNFDDSEILEFQMGVLEVISKVKNKRKNTTQPQLLPPQTPSYYPNNYPFSQHQPLSTSQMSYSNQFSAINSFQPQQPQTLSPNRQIHQFNNPQNRYNNESNHQQACSSTGQPREQRQEQTTAQYYKDFSRTSLSTSPETFPSASPSPAGSVYSETTYDFA